ncbi:unnamed protein product [Adineta ricciae]|uniref:Succinate dehydrogenase [ubiquinone] cytochrome b small subunit n=1 Tax=Adineta ricciae TaxID=249248 RepID=A0A814FRL8_ADIRI|nr:unnamed protein product [Adineta ricciae]
MGMSLNTVRGFRPIIRLFDPSTFTAYFLGGPSSKTIVLPVNGVDIQPVYLPHPQQPSMGVTGVNSFDHWKIERVIAVAMLAMIPGSFVYDSVFMNYFLAASLAIHAHWGMDSVLIDYCPKKALPLANVIRYVLTVLSFLGLCYFNYNDMGITRALKALWTIIY